MPPRPPAQRGKCLRGPSSGPARGQGEKTVSTGLRQGRCPREGERSTHSPHSRWPRHHTCPRSSCNNTSRGQRAPGCQVWRWGSRGVCGEASLPLVLSAPLPGAKQGGLWQQRRSTTSLLPASLGTRSQPQGGWPLCGSAGNPHASGKGRNTGAIMQPPMAEKPLPSHKPPLLVSHWLRTAGLLSSKRGPHPGWHPARDWAF